MSRDRHDVPDDTARALIGLYVDRLDELDVWHQIADRIPSHHLAEILDIRREQKGKGNR